jgi:diacylglycerol kinase (ATP)
MYRREGSGPRMISVGVIVHSGKTFGGGLEELRRTLAAAGYTHPLWYEVAKSSKAHKAIRKALDKGARLLFIWGGDGMVQRCIDAVRGHDVALAILPAGTGNLLATDLGIPRDIARAVEIGLEGERRRLDVGVANGERFAVMAGTGFDAIMIRETSSQEKEELGRLAYIRSSVKAMRARRVRMSVRLDGAKWFKGKASCVLIGNIGKATGGIQVFDDASPFDGILNVGLVTTKNVWEWARVFLRLATDRRGPTQLLKRGTARKITVRLQRKRPYEIDGGIRPATKKLEIRIRARAVTLCVPRSSKQDASNTRSDG